MPTDDHRLGAPDIEITPEMVKAGVGVLADKHGVVSEWAAEELAQEVFRAMIKRAKICSFGRDPHSGGNETGA
jgi:hypothetical protein